MGSFGEAMKILRKRKRLYMPELAKKVGVVQSYISRIERGLEIPSSKLARRIAKVLGASEDMFNDLAMDDKKEFFNNYVEKQYEKK